MCCCRVVEEAFDRGYLVFEGIPDLYNSDNTINDNLSNDAIDNRGNNAITNKSASEDLGSSCSSDDQLSISSCGQVQRKYVVRWLGPEDIRMNAPADYPWRIGKQGKEDKMSAADQRSVDVSEQELFHESHTTQHLMRWSCL